MHLAQKIRPNVRVFLHFAGKKAGIVQINNEGKAQNGGQEAVWALRCR
ncbi:MAG TPA: hypothetical protein IAC48_00470 [Candidatus Limiplasma stercoravium]|nr:hypothetical protein [Candidatus Limiplasma stercoravium]